MKFKFGLFIFWGLFSFFNFSTTPIIYSVGGATYIEDKVSFLISDKVSERDLILSIIKDDFSFYEDEVRVNFLSSEEEFKKSIEGTFLVNISMNKTKKIELEISKKGSLGSLLKKEIHFKDYRDKRSTIHEIAELVFQEVKGRSAIFKSKIVFSGEVDESVGSQRKELFICDFDGENVEQLTFHQSNVISPSFSFDKKKIVYSVIESKKGIKNINLYIYNLEDRSQKLISSFRGINSGAVFMRDNNHILLTLSYQGNAEIYKLNVHDKSLYKITNHYSDDVDPMVSFDGKDLLFVSGRSGKAHIYQMSLAKPEVNVKRITYVGLVNATPRYSPVREEAVFASWVDNNFDLFRVDLNGNQIVRLTKDFGNNENPTFSPDGKFILFSSERVLSKSKVRRRLMIINRDGEVVKELSKITPNAYTPWWSL